MTEIELIELEQLLRDRRDELTALELRGRNLRDVPALDLYGYDAGDRAVQDDDKNQIGQQTGAHLAELRALEAALMRMLDGTYGQCLLCDETISARRLRAVPHASLCVDCAEIQERERGEAAHTTM